MVKNRKSCDIGETVGMTPYFFPLQNVSENHFHKIGKLKKISQREDQNIKE